MNRDPSRPVEIVEEHASFLLVRCGPAFAVVEKRNGQIYPMKPGEREGVPMTAEAIASLLAGEEDWLPQDKARRLFDELCGRGDRLAQTIR